jgi:hypothetical protein
MTDPLPELLDELNREFPKFRIVYKRESSLSRLIDALLRVLTLGRMTRFMTVYHTVIGSTLYVPDSWDALQSVDRVILLRHERVHLRQRRRFSFLGLAFLYLIPWLPLGLAYGRARIEWEAYRETLAATLELKGTAALRDPRLREHVIQRFTGPDYGWMWPFRAQVEAWYDAAVSKLLRAASANQPTLERSPPKVR